MVLGTVSFSMRGLNNPRFNLLKQEEAKKLQIKTLVVTAGFDPFMMKGGRLR